MSKPRLLDLFSGAGGCTKGYQEAGFWVYGVDSKPQPNYCGDAFIQADAIETLELLLKGKPSSLWGTDDFVAIHASPPCQHYANVTQWRGDQADHPDLVGPTRDLLLTTGLPYVIENVDKAPLRACYMLCGSMFGLPIRRHRYFETNWSPLVLTQPCQHQRTDLAFEHKGERAYADAMGCQWMSAKEARQAVPPLYTKFVGEQLLEELNAPRGSDHILQGGRL